LDLAGFAEADIRKEFQEELVVDEMA